MSGSQVRSTAPPFDSATGRLTAETGADGKRACGGSDRPPGLARGSPIFGAAAAGAPTRKIVDDTAVHDFPTSPKTDWGR